MQWYFSKSGIQHGPVAIAELESKIRSGEVARDALVWRDGMGDWAPANTVDELARAFGKSAPGGSFYAPPAASMPTAYAPLANAKPTSGLAIASLICGVVGLMSCMFIPGIAAVICGHMAMRRTHPVTGNQEGRGMAIAGIVTGYLCVAGLVFIILYFVMIIGVIAAGASI